VAGLSNDARETQMTSRPVIVALLSVVCGLGVVRAENPSEKPAQQAADAWISLWDSGKYDETYDQLAEVTKKDISQRQWFEYWSAVRKPLGNVRSRRMIDLRTQLMPGPSGQESAMLQYKSSFEKNELVIEILGLVHEKDRGWRVANYQRREG